MEVNSTTQTTSVSTIQSTKTQESGKLSFSIEPNPLDKQGT